MQLLREYSKCTYMCAAELIWTFRGVDAVGLYSIDDDMDEKSIIFCKLFQ